jgi:predicted Fe-S protein YdhL (DUF1289 family)
MSSQFQSLSLRSGIPATAVWHNGDVLHWQPACPMCDEQTESAMSAIESPCILVCAMDPNTGYCFGCGRTRGEIEAWIDMTPERRREVMAELPARLETVERRPRRETRRARMARERGTTA